MKKTGFGKRALCMLLALVMIMSIVPSTVFAAQLGDILQKDTGLLEGSDIDVNDTISWPIKIYDYLNDGLMFEYSASDFGDAVYTPPSTGGYSNAASNPFVEGVTIGTDYTSVNGYFSNVSNQTPTYAMSEWGNRAAYAYPIDENATEVTRSVVGATATGAMHLKFTANSSLGTSYTDSGNNNRTYGWVSNFAKDDGKYYSAEDVRYIVIVYRTPGATSGHNIQPYWAVSRTGDYNADYTWFTQTRGLSGIDITDLCYDNYLTSADDNLPTFGWKAEGVRSTGMLTGWTWYLHHNENWSYAVYDMLSYDTSLTNGTQYGIYEPWTSDTMALNNTKLLNGECVAAVGMMLPLYGSGDQFELAQIAYFSTEAQAEAYGKQAVSFVSNPGTYTGNTVSISEKDSHYAPEVNDEVLAQNFITGTVPNYWTFGYTSTASSPSYSYSYRTSYPATNSMWDLYSPQTGNVVYVRRLAINEQYYSSTMKTWLFYDTYNNSYSNYNNKWITVDSSQVGKGYYYTRYVTLVYTTIGITDLKVNWWFSSYDDSNSSASEYITGYDETTASSSAQQYIVDVPQASQYLYDDGSNWYKNYYTVTLDLYELVEYIKGKGLTVADVKFDSLGMNFIGLDTNTTGGYNDSVCVAYCDFFTEETAAQAYGERIADYCNNYSTAVTNNRTNTLSIVSTNASKIYLGGNNKSFGFGHANTGGYLNDNYNGWGTNGNPKANNTNSNGFYAYGIGIPYTLPLTGYATRRSGATSYTGGTGKAYDLADSIYFVSTESLSVGQYGANVDVDDEGNRSFNYAQLPNLGYQLYSTLKGNAMVCTVGLLEGRLVTYTGVDGESYRVPTYKEETVYYVAELLWKCLCVPEYNKGGDQYLYNFVSGTAHKQFGVDKNGNATGTAMDLATALRNLLGIEFTSTNYNATNQTNTFYQPGKADFGSWDATTAKTNVGGKNQLIGPFVDCAPYIDTFYDAAYYILNNLFVDDSYNELQSDFNYLRLSKATLADGYTEAYVFDAGFGDIDGNSGVVYDTANKTIGLSTAVSLREVVYKIDAGVAHSTTIPFLPVVGGSYGPTGTSNVYDNGAVGQETPGQTYTDRNYNYTLQANGEFVYHEQDDLYFDFAGDDDVYLFINGELVMDLGGGHEITRVEFRMNEYAAAAREIMEILGFYEMGDNHTIEYTPVMSDAEFEALYKERFGSTETNMIGEVDLDRDGVYETETLTYDEMLRWHHLNLQESHAYTIDFYYMERHGTGANMRIMTNIVMTDPSLNTEKKAYQLNEYDEIPVDKEGNPQPLNYGAQVDDSKRIMYEFSATNNGNVKLYNLSFMDSKIGVNLTPENGLEIYGKGTYTTFTVSYLTAATFYDFEGIAVLDGVSYQVTDGSALGVRAGRHTLNLYQVGSDTLFDDVVARVVIGSGTGGTSQIVPSDIKGVYTLEEGKVNLVPVAGVRVTNMDGEALQVSDLVFKVDGYESAEAYEFGEPMGTIEVMFEDNEQVKAFLHNLESPDTESEYDYNVPLYSGDGLWQHATLTVSGIWYTFAEDDRDAKMFQNTVYTYAYEDKDIAEESIVIKSQDQQKVFMMGGEPVYYQWAGHTLHLQFDMIWKDMYESCSAENSALYDYKTQIQEIEAYEKNHYIKAEGDDKDDWANARYAVNYQRFTVELCNASGLVFEDGVAYDEDGDEVDWQDEYVSWDPDLLLATVTYEATGVHCFYLKVTHTTYPDRPIVVPVSIYSADTNDVVYVLDYGVNTVDLNTNSQLFNGDKLLGNLDKMTAALMGIYLAEPYYEEDNLEQESSLGIQGNPTGGNKYYDYGWNGNKAYVRDNHPTVALTSSGGKYVGALDWAKFTMSTALPDSGVAITYDGSKYNLASSLSFAPTTIMEQAQTFYLGLSVHEKGLTFGGNSSMDYETYRTMYFDYSVYAINPGNQVTMYKAVTILPANVVYYEDDFAGITYEGDMVQSNDKTAGQFVHHGNGSGSLIQSLDNTGIHGQDSAYQQSTNTEMSGNSMTTIKITDTSKVMSFDFTGTGFELVGKTNATDSAIMVVEVLNADGDQVYYMPVITEFDNGNDGGNEAINQVPLVRLNDLEYGSYTVNIYGNPSYDFSNWDGDIDNLESCIVPTYLYVDGVRIFQSLMEIPGYENEDGEYFSYYGQIEETVTFTSVRDKIVGGSIGVAMLDDDGLSVSAGTATWTENRLGTDASGTVEFVGNQVSGVDDYLIMGPNNEVYMESFGSDSALVMYVIPYEDVYSLQIGVRALDYGMFNGIGSTNPDLMLELGIYKDGEYQWLQIANVCSSTEQYYEIPLEDCPEMDDGSYQVVLRAVNASAGQPGMIAYTMIKSSGLELISDTAEMVTKYYDNGVLVCFDHKEDAPHFEDGKCCFCGEIICWECAQVARTVVASCGQAVEGSYVDQSGWNLWALEQQMTATTVNEGERVEIEKDEDEVVEDITLPELSLKYASLSFEEEIRYNMYFTAENLDDVEDMGLLVFETFQNDATIIHADQIISQYSTDGTTYMAQTAGVAAKNMGDTYYFRAYARLSNGRYVYSAVEPYNAVKYAKSILAKSQSEEMKALVVSMLNFGAEAQLYFGYKTDWLMNASLTAEQQALVQAYSDDTMPDVGTVDEEKNTQFHKRAFTDCYVTASFDSAFALNYYFTTWFVPEGEVRMYYWTEEDYAKADELTPETASGSVMMKPTGEENQYFASLDGIAAKEMGDTVYVGAIYHYSGMVYHTNLINYSMGRYCDTIANRETSAQRELSMATAVYGACAKAYFDSL